MISALPDGGDRSAIEGVAKTVIGAIGSAQKSPEPVPLEDGDGDEE
jgi:hypothetical protein